MHTERVPFVNSSHLASIIRRPASNFVAAPFLGTDTTWGSNTARLETALQWAKKHARNSVY